MVLLDTDVLVDCLRGAIPATTWLQQHRREEFGVPGVVAMELVMGARDASDLQRIQKFLASFTVVWPESSEFSAAHQLLITHRLSSGLNIPDCLIAAMAVKRRARLYTFNLKHFGIVQGLDVHEPYSR